LTALIAIAAGALVGLLAYNHLTGRRFVRDLAHRARLQARSLQGWDHAWAENKNKSEIFVCLTTTPSRLPYIAPTLKSLLAQSKVPAGIRLHIPTFSARENRSYHVPRVFRALASVEVIRCDDDGPISKILPALEAFPPDQKLVAVDDDMIYPPSMIAHFDRESQKRPHAVISSSGWLVPADGIDRPTTLLSNLRGTPPVPMKCSRIRRPTRVDIFQGYSAFLVQPSFFSCRSLCDYENAPDEARTVDDVWLSAHCKVEKWVLPHGRYCVPVWRHWRHFANTSLGLLNRGGGDLLRRPNTILIRHFRHRWLVGLENAAGDTSEPRAHRHRV